MNASANIEPAKDALSIVTNRDGLLRLDGGRNFEREHPIAQIVAKTIEPITISAIAVCIVAELTTSSPLLGIQGPPPIPLFQNSTAIRGSPQS